MRRRDFLLLAAGAAIDVPLRARAEPSFKRIGWISGLGGADRQYGADQEALTRGLKELGWIGGENYQIEPRLSAGDPRRFADFASALVRSRQDIILVSGGEAAIRPLQQESHDIPILFLGGFMDPVGSKLVASLERPGANITGISDFSPKLGTVWVETLKEIAPKTARVGVFSSGDEAGQAILKLFLPTIEAAAQKHRLKASVIEVAAETDIAGAVAAFGEKPGAGLIVLPEIFSLVHFKSIIAAAASTKVPAIYSYSVLARSGGLVSYAADSTDPFYHAAGYIDRILKGAKPGDLPVLEPGKFDLVINMKTAKALGISLPPKLRDRASEVIE